jgi:hypothetical protein
MNVVDFIGYFCTQIKQKTMNYHSYSFEWDSIAICVGKNDSIQRLEVCEDRLSFEKTQ